MGSDFTSEELHRVFREVEYISPSSDFEESERTVLYNIYLEHLKSTERAYSMTNDQKKQEFERILNGMLNR
jgi:hypothetical protein